jgi:hypothetical protein
MSSTRQAQPGLLGRITMKSSRELLRAAGKCG